MSEMPTGDARSSCLGKVPYRTKGEALITLERMGRRRAKLRTLKRGERLKPYACDHCQQWHIGGGRP